MSRPLRLLFVHGPADGALWRAGFDLAQAAAALDMPVEIAFAGAGLSLVYSDREGATGPATGAFASLELLGVDSARAPIVERESQHSARRTALPLTWLCADDWQRWLRCAPLQVW